MVPTRTEIYLARDLRDIDGGLLLRVSSADDAPWREVLITTDGMWTDAETGVRSDFVRVRFLDDERERVLKSDEPVEVGFRPVAQ